jgi:CheY-like chemotaxis protein/HPt (histidine-containing phosphotransfer) domain-containing protein
VDPVKLLDLHPTDLAVCLPKPVLPSSLFNAIMGLLAEGSPPPPPPQALQHHCVRLPGARILLAEDNQINQMVAEEILRLVGCTVSVAANGRIAADMAMSQEFDAVLMDCQMPEMDGFESTRLIRKLESELKTPRHVPIIALTASAIKGDREMCLAAGMDGYVTKPIDAQEMLAAIQALIPEQRMNSAPLGPSAQPPAPPVAADTPVNLPDLHRRCMGNEKLAAKALQTFAAAIGSYSQELARCVQSGDGKSLSAAAHKIKGAAGNVSAVQLSRLAGELEKLGKSDAVAQAQACLAEILREVERVREFIAADAKERIDV